MLEYSNQLNELLNMATVAAVGTGEQNVGTEHVLYIMTCEGGLCASTLAKCGITKGFFLQYPSFQRAAGGYFVPLPFSPRLMRALAIAEEKAEVFHADSVRPEHLLFALCFIDGNSGVADVFSANNFSLDDAKKIIYDSIRDSVEHGYASDYDYYDNKNNFNNNNNTVFFRQSGAVQSADSLIRGESEKKYDLSSFGTDVTARARDGKLDPVICRDTEIQRVIQTLCRRTKNNPILIGEAGVGKSAIVEGLASLMVVGDVPEELKGKILFSLDLTSLVAGTKFRGEFEERAKALLDEVIKRGNVILFIDEIHTLLQAGDSEGGLNLGNILKPMLARGDISIIGATTFDEYRRYFEKDVALERRFQPVAVNEPTPEQAIEILKGIKGKYEAYHAVSISDEAIETAVRLSKRYITDRFLPDKAVDLIDEAAAKSHVNSSQASFVSGLDVPEFTSPNTIKTIGKSEILSVLEERTGVPVSELGSDDAERLSTLENSLKSQVIGQDAACEAVARAIRRGRAGLKDPRRPIGSFIFMGPTGVGKTELAKVLAREVFSGEDSLIKIDMSEYMTKESVTKLIGTPPGYAGYEDGGRLTEAVRRKPYSVVLFDEVEKGHPDVNNILLQLLDEGTLTDSHGRKTDFKNTVVIITSNIGVKEAADANKTFGFAGFSENSTSTNKNAYLNALKDYMRPEIINRLDEIVVFNKLGKTELMRIVDLMLRSLAERLKNKNIALQTTDACRRYLVDEGYEEDYGARPLRRTIQRLVEDVLSEKIIDGEIKDNSSVLIDCVDGQLVFSKN